ncbi:carbon storage regulator [Salicibibacter halophilus]|uniref:Translational regulator CsrA n=1 Tax=Salicibibacter halophilus TaxID=2502791 RepID=A0A514LJ10_9BACI|nr:carbon storage regulator CsrA [Salicibibacter halophilus]QDI91839.1 carbon storage regulator [Salicibibacter halophilus]
MLILTRKRDESIQIGDGIEVKIVSVEGDQVKLGIDAPQHVDIHRKEIYECIEEENRVAAISSGKIPSQLTFDE